MGNLYLPSLKPDGALTVEPSQVARNGLGDGTQKGSQLEIGGEGKPLSFLLEAL